MVEGSQSDELRDLTTKLVREKMFKIAEWRESQVVDLIEQLIRSGDILQYVMVGIDGKYGVCYVPFREKEMLQTKIKELEAELDKFELVAGNTYEYCDPDKNGNGS